MKIDLHCHTKKVKKGDAITRDVGQKGTGKSEIINSLKNYCVDTSTSSSVYIGNEKEVDFSKLIKVENVVVSPNKMGLVSMEEEFQELYEWNEELPTSLMKYVSWYTTKDNNRNKGRMKITESVHIEDAQENERLESLFHDSRYGTAGVSIGYIQVSGEMTPIDEVELMTLFETECEGIVISVSEVHIVDVH